MQQLIEMGNQISQFIPTEITDWLMDMTPLQIFWAAQVGITGCVLAYRVATGTYWDKSEGPTKDEPLGWFQFRRRVGQYHVLGSVWGMYLLWTLCSAYHYGTPPNALVDKLLALATGPGLDSPSVDSTCAVIGLSMLTLHNLRHLFENIKVNVLSNKRTLNPLGLLLAVAFPVAAGISVIAEAPILHQLSSWLDISSVKWFHLPAALVFALASFQQWRVHHMFAKLRRNKAGHIVTTNYKIPKGGPFDWISSPQYTTELLIYGSIGVALGAHCPTWWWLTGYMCCHHVYMAYNSHKLLHAKFEDYPRTRKMIIPYLL